MSLKTREAWQEEGGFALVLALLSLLVLTFLGLTLAATTSTELQIASNYRWSQQALYNAEAGLEVAKVYLRAVPNDWATILPAIRVGSWSPGTPPALPTYPAGWQSNPVATRDWENSGCDNYFGTGYGIVLTSKGALPAPNGPQNLQGVTQVFGQNLTGSFTVWIRRSYTQSPVDGTITDDPTNSVAILTSEGIAPAAIPSAARRVLELRVQGASFDCQSQSAMSGAGQGGAGFATCRHFESGCNAAGSLQGAFGAASRSTGSTAGFSTQQVGSLCDTGQS